MIQHKLFVRIFLMKIRWVVLQTPHPLQTVWEELSIQSGSTNPVFTLSSSAYTPALCIHIQSRIVSSCSGVNFSACQCKMDHRAKYEINCCLSRIKSKKRLICCEICLSINCVVFKHNYYLSCFFVLKAS